MRSGDRQIKHVFWDWNGTLLDDARLCSSIINGILSENGLHPLSYEKYRETFDFPVRTYYERLGLSGKGVSFEQTSFEFIENYRRRWRVCSLQVNAKITLQSIKSLGLPQSIITAGKESLLHGFVEHHGLTKYFEGLIGVDHIYASGKVERAIQYMELLGLGPGEVVLIGDTLHDNEVASAIGAKALMYSNGHHTREKLETSGAPVISCLSQVLDFLE